MQFRILNPNKVHLKVLLLPLFPDHTYGEYNVIKTEKTEKLWWRTTG